MDLILAFSCFTIISSQGDMFFVYGIVFIYSFVGGGTSVASLLFKSHQPFKLRV
jgi:hypothetical protein